MTSYNLAAIQGFGSYDDAALEGFGSYDDAALEGFGSYDDAALEGFGNKRKHFVKGSPEAKAFMAKLRAMRGKKSVRKARGGKKFPSETEVAKIVKRLKELREKETPAWNTRRKIRRFGYPQKGKTSPTLWDGRDPNEAEMEGGSLLEGLLLKAPYKVVKGIAKGIKHLIDKKKK